MQMKKQDESSMVLRGEYRGCLKTGVKRNIRSVRRILLDREVRSGIAQRIRRWIISADRKRSTLRKSDIFTHPFGLNQEMPPVVVLNRCKAAFEIYSTKKYESKKGL